MTGDCVIQCLDQGYGGRLAAPDQAGISILRHRKEQGLMLGRHAHQRGQGGQMLAFPLSHLLSQILEIEARKGRDLVFSPDLPVVRATGGAAADAEGATPKGAVGRRHEGLWQNVLLVLEIGPEHFPRPAAWSRVRIRRERYPTLHDTQTQHEMNSDHSLHPALLSDRRTVMMQSAGMTDRPNYNKWYAPDNEKHSLEDTRTQNLKPKPPAT